MILAFGKNATGVVVVVMAGGRGYGCGGDLSPYFFF